MLKIILPLAPVGLLVVVTLGISTELPCVSTGFLHIYPCVYNPIVETVATTDADESGVSINNLSPVDIIIFSVSMT